MRSFLCLKLLNIFFVCNLILSKLFAKTVKMHFFMYEVWYDLKGHWRSIKVTFDYIMITLWRHNFNDKEHNLRVHYEYHYLVICLNLSKILILWIFDLRSYEQLLPCSVQIEQKGMPFDNDFGYSLPTFSSLLKRENKKSRMNNRNFNQKACLSARSSVHY